MCSSTYDRVLPSGAIRQLMVSQLSSKVLRATERVRFQDRHYPVIDTITKPTLQQRSHDKKVRIQAAWISGGISVFASVIVDTLFPHDSK